MPQSPEAGRLVDLACLHYQGIDGPGRWAEAQALLAADPACRRDLAVACVCGDVDVVRALVDEDRGAARRPLGPLGWPPLIYACASRLGYPGLRTGPVIEALVAAGADADSHVRITDCCFTALTFLMGGGEQGLHRQPPHPAWEGLARLLLAHGARADDGQALYNRCFQDDDAPLRLLLDHGLHRDHGWRFQEGGEIQATPLLTWLLWHAVTSGFAKRVGLLLDHGARFDDGVVLPYGERRPLLVLVGRSGDAALIQAFADHGHALPDLAPADALVAAANAGDQGSARGLVGRHPGLLTTARADLADTLRRAAARGALPTLRILLDLGINPGSDGERTALHEAAWHGQTEAIEILLAAGADPQAKDPAHHATPASWAAFNHQTGAQRILGGRA